MKGRKSRLALNFPWICVFKSFTLPSFHSPHCQPCELFASLSPLLIIQSYYTTFNACPPIGGAIDHERPSRDDEVRRPRTKNSVDRPDDLFNMDPWQTKAIVFNTVSPLRQGRLFYLKCRGLLQNVFATHQPDNTQGRRSALVFNLRLEHQSGPCSNVRAMSTQPMSKPSTLNTTAPNATDVETLANRYRTTRVDDLALVNTFFRHPVAARSIRPGAFDHEFALPDATGLTAVIRTHRVPVPKGLVRELSSRYSEYLTLNHSPVYLFTASVAIHRRGTLTAVPDVPDDQDYIRARALAEALNSPRDAGNIHNNGTDPGLGALRFSWLGDRTGRIFTSPPELFAPRSRAA